MNSDFNFTLSSNTITVSPNSQTTVVVTQAAVGGFAFDVVYTLAMNANPKDGTTENSSGILCNQVFPSVGVPLLGGSGTVDLTIIVLDVAPGTYIGYINGNCPDQSTGYAMPLYHNQQLTITVS